MCKRINQYVENGRVNTSTTGFPQGGRPNFDVKIESPAFGQHRSTMLTVDVGFEMEFDGRQARTLYDVLERHFKQVDKY